MNSGGDFSAGVANFSCHGILVPARVTPGHIRPFFVPFLPVAQGTTPVGRSRLSRRLAVGSSFAGATDGGAGVSLSTCCADSEPDLTDGPRREAGRRTQKDGCLGCALRRPAVVPGQPLASARFVELPGNRTALLAPVPSSLWDVRSRYSY